MVDVGREWNIIIRVFTADISSITIIAYDYTKPYIMD